MTGSHANIIQVKTAYVNSYLLKNGKNSMLVDSGIQRSGKIVLQAIGENGLELKDIRLIILTHPHYDHCLGARAIQEATGAVILAQQDSASALQKGYRRLPRGTNLPVNAWVSMGRIFMPWLAHFPPVEPGIVFDRQLELSDYGIEARAIHTPGHTAGSLTVIYEGKHAFVGDTLFGVKKKSPYPPFADDPVALIRSWKALIDEGIEYIYPGHGSPFDAGKLMEDYERRKEVIG